MRGAIMYMKAEPKLPGKAGGAAGPVAGADQVDVGLAVDLAAAEEEQVDAALAGEVEQLARALGEGVAGALVQQGETDIVTQLAHQPACGGGDGARGADRDVSRGLGARRIEDEARDGGGEDAPPSRITRPLARRSNTNSGEIGPEPRLGARRAGRSAATCAGVGRRIRPAARSAKRPARRRRSEST